MIRAHKNAVLTRLRQDTLLAGRTYEPDEIIKGAEAYCVVYSDNGWQEQSRLTGPLARVTYTYTIHSVARTQDAAQKLAESVYAQLLNWTPTVTGRKCWRIRPAASQPVRKDDDARIIPLYYGVDVFELTSEPA